MGKTRFSDKNSGEIVVEPFVPPSEPNSEELPLCENKENTLYTVPSITPSIYNPINFQFPTSPPEVVSNGQNNSEHFQTTVQHNQETGLQQTGVKRKHSAAYLNETSEVPKRKQRKLPSGNILVVPIVSKQDPKIAQRRASERPQSYKDSGYIASSPEIQLLAHDDNVVQSPDPFVVPSVSSPFVPTHELLPVVQEAEGGQVSHVGNVAQDLSEYADLIVFPEFTTGEY